MAMENRGKERQRTGKIISVANLPDEFTIQDLNKFISNMRTTVIRKIREHNGLTLEEVSSQLHIPIEELSSIEEGKVNAAHMRLLYKLAQFYHVSYQRLLFLFKLVREVSPEEECGVAAYYNGELDAETEKQLKNLVTLLKDM